MTVYYKDKNLPHRIKECRTKKNITQPELSKLLGFKGDKYTIYCYETNRRLPSIEILIKMHQIFDVSLDYLLCLDDYKNHIEYITNALGLNNSILDLYLKITENQNAIKRINKYIHSHYKEFNYETDRNKK